MKLKIYHSHLTSLILSLLLTGCGMEGGTESNPSGEGLSSLAWTSTTPAQLDTGTGLVVAPIVAKAPSGGTAMAVWLELADLNTSDSKPAVYHLYARRFSGTGWATNDSGCPAGSGANDGICVIDTGSLDFSAWAPQVDMDAVGNAVVVWQQVDGSNSNIYARRFHVAAGSCGTLCWEGAEEIDDTVSSIAGNAYSPDVAMEPDGGGTGMAVWEQNRPGTVIEKQLDGTKKAILTISPIFFGQVYLGQGTGGGEGDVLFLDGTVSFDGSANTIRSLEVFEAGLFAGQGSGGNLGDIYVCNPATAGDTVLCDALTDWTLSRDETGGVYEEVNILQEAPPSLYAGMGSGAGDGDILVCDPEFVDNEGLPTLNDTAGAGGTTTTLVDTTPPWPAAQDISDAILTITSGALNGQVRMITSNTDTVLTVSPGWSQAPDGMTYSIKTVNDEVNCTTADWVSTPSFDGGGAGYEKVLAMTVLNGVLYAGSGTSNGDADIRYCDPAFVDDQNFIAVPPTQQSLADESRCTPADWSSDVKDFGVTYNIVQDLEVFNGRLYAVLGDTDDGDGDIYVCDPNGVGVNPTICESGEWSISKDFTGAAPGGYQVVQSLGVFGSNLYAGTGSSKSDFSGQVNGQGDIWVCDPTTGGDTGTAALTCEPDDWSLKFDGNSVAEQYSDIYAIVPVGGTLLFATGGNGAADGDVLKIREFGFRILARRLTNVITGTWDPPLTSAPPAIDTGEGNAYGAQVAMDNSGNAVATLIQFRPGTCLGIQTPPIETQEDQFDDAAQVPCGDDRLIANRFNGTAWNNPGPTDLTPNSTLADGRADCFNLNLDGKADSTRGIRVNACVDISNVRLGMATNGVAFVAFKTVQFNQADESFDSGGDDNKDFRKQIWDANNTFNHHEIYVNARVCKDGGDAGTIPCDTASEWGPNRALAQWFFQAWRQEKDPLPLTDLTRILEIRSNCGPDTLITSGSGTMNSFVNSQDSDNNGSKILNCDFDALQLAVDPDDGASALLLAERYTSTTSSAAQAIRDIIAFRYNGNATTEWQKYSGAAWSDFTTTQVATTSTTDPSTPPFDPDSFTPIDAGSNFPVSNDAFTPQVAMDNSGNAQVVWVQRCITADSCGSGDKSHIWSRPFTSPSTWGTRVFIDNNVGAETHYYNPVLAMDQVGGANSAMALFIGYSTSSSTFGSFRLYGVTGP